MAIDDINIKETDFIGQIKKQVLQFIENSKSLDKNQKQELIKELGTDWYDDRFEGKTFIESATEMLYLRWSIQQKDYMALWEKIVIENAKINNKPQLVANNVVQEYKKQFKLK